ncbi:c-type cytochrome biogenesis protein CcmI [Aestuariibius sp. 2305UL40-4]|uniref:c-type cytochrome biogenesis protein CcmI n=1 Tax=Aestuariibius violaceus TaxID=3234132 RepID=UPI00345EBFF3
MVFWIVSAALVALSLAALGRALLAPPNRAGGNDMSVYRDQLDEIDRDRARGLISDEEAERIRTEVARRLLAADARGTTDQTDAPKGATRAALAFAALAIAGGGLGLYAVVGDPGRPDLPHEVRLAAAQELRTARGNQEALEATAPAITPPPLSEDEQDLMRRLREAVAERPDDLQGLTLLVQYESRLGRFAEARMAQQRIIDLKTANGTLDPLDEERLWQLMQQAAGGRISPELEAQITARLTSNAADPAARYYLGLLHAQTGRPDLTFQLWRPIVETPGTGLYGLLARQGIERAAFEAGVDYAPPPILTDDPDQTAAIEGMVAGLADRLATEGGPPSDWARLIRSYGVLGRTDAATAIWQEAQEVFGGNAQAMTELHQAARAAGVAD